MKNSVVTPNKNIMFNDIKFGTNKRSSGKPVVNNTNNPTVTSNNGNPPLQQINQTSISSNSFNPMLNNNSNVNLLVNKYKDFTYNEEFYETLSKNTVLPIIEQTGASKLLNQITQNHNASISTTTGQYVTTLNDISESIEENRNLIDSIKSHIKIMAKDVIRLPKEIKEDYADDIVLLKEMYNKHLSDQKRENIRLQREVSSYQKENIDLQNEIYYLLGRLNALEKEVGLKAKGYTYNEENLINDGEVLYIIKTEDI